MKASLRSTAKKVSSAIARLLAKCHLLPDRVIIAMDGGICSQMHFYLVGYMLTLRGEEVQYDLRWFRESGMDLDNRFCRNFDLLRLFPYLDFTEARHGLLTRIYLSAFYRHNNYFTDDEDPFAWLDIRGPRYVDGYFHDPEQMYSEYFRRVFRIVPSHLDSITLKKNEYIKDVARDFDICAVHVRRGDLARYNKAYGEPADIGYFFDACMRVAEYAANPVWFFIFSDEPEWCSRNLLPPLAELHAEVFYMNGSDRGYSDLALMSRCHHVITSQGSMGKYAALLREEEHLDGLVVLPDTPYSRPWIRRFANAEVIASATSDRT